MKKWLVTGTIALAAVLVSGAFAAIPSADGVIHGCYKQFAGTLRVVDAEAGGKCTNKEKSLAWNQQGPKGDMGLQGPQGPQGPAGTSTVTFAISPPVDLASDGTSTHVISKDLPAGDWAVVAYVNTTGFGGFDGDFIRDAVCELRNGANVIGWAADRRIIPELDQVRRSLSLNGGAHLPGGGQVSVWCRSQLAAERVDQAQVMIMRVGGFS